MHYAHYYAQSTILHTAVYMKNSRIFRKTVLLYLCFNGGIKIHTVCSINVTGPAKTGHVRTKYTCSENCTYLGHCL